MKLAFPSIDQVVASVARIVKRFPFVVLLSLVGTTTAIWFADLSFATQEEYPRLLAVSFVSALGISFFFAIATFLEQKEWGIFIKYGVKLLGLSLLLVYYFVIGDTLFDGSHEVFYRFFLLVLGSHFLVAFTPFLGSDKLDQFWEYNKTLFLRILLSVLYSGVLFVGLSIALLAIDNLLGLDIDGETYAQLFLFLGGIFNTWFFLAGVPEKEAIQSEKIIFPIGLRVFVQYVLIPLVSVYIFILYLYLAKIISQWELPNGWVSNLVLSFSIAGILSLLLLYPIRNSKEFKWVSFYSKYYYLALIPLIGLLLFSIWIRISEYGVTINRYFVATLGVWLTGIVIYFILSKAKNIKVIPISLCLITLATLFGPLGAFAVSERSQLGRFEEVLDRNGMLDENNQIIPRKEGEEVTFEDRKQLSSVVDYIVENHSSTSFMPYFDALSDSVDSSSEIFKLIGLDYVARWINANDEADSFHFSMENTWASDVSGFDEYLNNIILNPGTDSERIVKSAEGNWRISIDSEKRIFRIEDQKTQKSIDIELDTIINSLRKKSHKLDDNYFIPISELQFDFENDELKTRLYVNIISGSYGNEVTLTNVTSDILIKRKQ